MSTKRVIAAVLIATMVAVATAAVALSRGTAEAEHSTPSTVVRAMPEWVLEGVLPGARAASDGRAIEKVEWVEASVASAMAIVGKTAIAEHADRRCYAVMVHGQFAVGDENGTWRKPIYVAFFSGDTRRLVMEGFVSRADLSDVDRVFTQPAESFSD